jgi:mono/diheme cytochrome c family protein
MACRLIARRLVVAVAWTTSCCAGVACDWPWHHDMVDGPARPAGAGPRSAVTGTLPVDGELRRDLNATDLIDPIAPSAPTAPGRALYGVYCAPCHGMSGTGDGSVAKYYVPVGDLTSREVQQHIDSWFYAVIVSGTKTMPSYGHELQRMERWQIVRFTRSLARNP